MSKTIIMRSGTKVTIVFGGKTQSFSFETEAEASEMAKKANQLRQEGKEEELKEFLDPSYKIKHLGDIVKDRYGNYFLKDTSVPMPVQLVQRIKEYLDDGISPESLYNFWKLLLTNPNKHVREDLFHFADRFHFPITSQGYFIAYKSVAWVGERHKDFALFVAKDYVYKKAQGLDTSDYTVVEYKDPDGTTVINSYKEDELDAEKERLIERYFDAYPLEEWLNANLENPWEDWKAWKPFHSKEVETEPNGGLKSFAKEMGWNEDEEVTKYAMEESKFTIHGNLDELFKNISQLFQQDEPMFTDWHTRSMDIRLGVPVEMPMEECDTDPNNTCSSGLHVGAPGYVKSFGGYEGRYILAVLVNPADVAAVPVDYNYEKMRTARYYPYAICEFNDKEELEELETKYFEDDYMDYEKQQLEAKLKELTTHQIVSGNEALDEEQLMTLLKERLTYISTN